MRSLVGTVLNKPPVPYASQRLSFPFLQRNDAEAQMRAMGSVGTLFAIVHRTSNATAQVEWRLWRKAASGLAEDRTEVTRHAALDLWNRPNPFYSRQEFVETFQQHIDLTGEGWWVVGRNPRSPLPLELWPIRPDRIAPVPHATEFIDGYVYTGPDGEKIPLKLDEVMQLKMPNPLDPYRGLGPVQAVLVDLDSTRYSAEWNRNFFINSAEPGGIVEVDKRLSDPEFDDMTTRFRESHQGVANAHRVAVLEQGAKWVQRAFTQRDMQFVELRSVSREIIREAFGMSKTMLGQTEDVNRATAEAAEYVFAKYQVTERLERIKGVLNTELLPLYGPGAGDLEFDYENPVPENAEADNAERDSRVAAAVALIDAGFNPAEVLEAHGLPEMMFGLPGTDPDRDLLTKLVVGAPTLAPMILPMLGFNLPESTAPTPAGPAAVPPPPAALPAARLGHHRHEHGPRNADDDDNKQQQLEQVQQDWEEILDELMGDWADITAAQRAEIHDQVRDAVEDGDPAALAEITVDAERGADLLSTAMVKLSAIAARRMVEEAASQDVDIEPVEADAAELTGFAVGTARILGQALSMSAGREALRLATSESTGEEVADRVLEFLEALSDRQTQDQLGGALSNAQNTARIATLRSAPTAAYYADETLDGNTCINCRAVDGKWLGNDLDEVEEVYPNGGYTECLGRERCRGTVTAIWRPEQVDERP